MKMTTSRVVKLRFEPLEDRWLLAGGPIQVFLLAGQSNMGGGGIVDDLPAPYDTPQDDVWIWQDDLGANVGWTSLRGGFSGGSNYGSGGGTSAFGPEVALGRTVADAVPESQFALIKYVKAGTGATMQDGWSPDRGGGDGPGQFWTKFIARSRDALTALDDSQLSYEIAGLFVAQGTRDLQSETGVEAANYQQNFTQFIAGVRQEFGVPDLPVVFGQCSDAWEWTDDFHDGAVLVRAAQEAVAAADPLVTMVQVDDLSRKDPVHFDTEGQLTLGSRFAHAYLDVPFEGSAKVATETFETGDFRGGYRQWSSGAWTTAGDASVTSGGGPRWGNYHAQLRNATGDLSRVINVSGLTNMKLRFWSKLNSFEASDRAQVKVSGDGVNWTTLLEFVDGQDDNQYRFHDVHVPDLGDTLHVRFDARMDNPDDTWYVDNIKVAGTTQPGGTTISISDATIAEEGSFDVFVPYGSGGLERPSGLIFGPDGNLYVGSTTTDDSIYRVDGETGAFIDEFVPTGSGGLESPQGMVFRPDGKLYVASQATDTVLRYDAATGAFVDEFVSAGSGGLDGPKSILFGPDGNGDGVDDLYVNAQFSNAVYRYDGLTGAAMPGPLGSAGSAEFVPPGSGGVDKPTCMTMGLDGQLYVASRTTNEILRYDVTSGAFLGAFVTAGSGGLVGPRGLVFGPDRLLYVGSSPNNTIIRYDGTTGAFVDVITSAPAGLDFPRGLVFDAVGNLFVSSSGASHDGPGDVLRFSQGLQVSLSAPSAQTVTVDYSTADGTAIGGSDYTAVSGTLTFAPGETTKTILLVATNDVNAEGNETFLINLSNLTGGATIGDGQGVGTIIDDDDADNVVAQDDVYSMDEDQTLDVPSPGVLTNDSDDLGHAVTAKPAEGPSHGTLTLRPDGSFTYRPDENFHGTDSFTYVATDGDADSKVATVSLTIHSVNDAPEAVDDTYTTDVNSALSPAAPGLLDNDTDIEADTLTPVKLTDPQHALFFQFNADGSFVYVPQNDYQGPDSFTYKVTDGQLESNVATVTITVGTPRHPGDADLSGWTDLSDFNIWNANKFIAGTGWSTGDFNGDGTTDLSDFNIWNAHKFTTAVPPPPVHDVVLQQASRELQATIADLADLLTVDRKDDAQHETESAVDKLLATYWP